MKILQHVLILNGVLNAKTVKCVMDAKTVNSVLIVMPVLIVKDV